MKYRSLAEAATATSVPYCRGIVNGIYCGDLATTTMDHRRGFVRDGTVHLADRERITKAILRRFCLLAAEAELGDAVDAMSAWEARWRRCARADEIARTRLRVRIPKSYWSTDRWTVRAALSSVPTDHPSRAEAMAWARLAEGA